MRLVRLGLLSAALPLAGCLGNGAAEGGLGGFFAPGERQSAPVLPRANLFGGRVVVAGPDGYCIDCQSLSRNRGGAFVLIASCESLTGEREKLVEPAVLTISVLPAQAGATPPDAEALAALATGARILQSADDDGLSYVQLSSGGDSLLPEGDPRHWRGSLLINDHLVGLAVYGPSGSTAAGALGGELLRTQAQIIRQLSPAPD